MPFSVPIVEGMSTLSRYTTREVCERLRCNRSTLQRYLRTGRFPQPIVLGNKHIWTEADIDLWERQNRRKVRVA